MHPVLLYQKENGEVPLRDFLAQFEDRSDKTGRLVREKTQDYINLLQTKGTAAGMPFLRHLEGAIWELRPLRYRILFAQVDGGFLLLHAFMKKTQKTPKRELSKAIRELDDYLKRETDSNE